MITLMFALLASPMTVPSDQAVQATLQSCSMEGGRWVCRYAVPDIEIVPIPGSDIVTDAPAAVVGAAPSHEGTAPTPPMTVTVPMTTVPATPTTVPPPPTVTGPAITSPATTTGTATGTTTATAATLEPGPIRPIDSGVLTEGESRLVARCADAGWMSLCLPDDRREARTLRDKQNAYLAVRRDVTRLLGENQCQAAVRTALDGGYLALARETREYCTSASSSAPTSQTPARRPASTYVPAPTPAPVVPPVVETTKPAGH